MGRKAGGLYINPKKFGGVVKPCMMEMVSFLNCLALNKQSDDKCMRQKELLVACSQAQVSTTLFSFFCIPHKSEFLTSAYYLEFFIPRIAYLNLRVENES